jgi:hypothetical protein
MITIENSLKFIEKKTVNVLELFIKINWQKKKSCFPSFVQNDNDRKLIEILFSLAKKKQKMYEKCSLKLIFKKMCFPSFVKNDNQSQFVC